MQKENQVKSNDTFKGFPLFNDIEDAALKYRNRGVIMANMLEDHFKQGKISAKGSLFLLGYMNSIPAEERALTMESFMEKANERGFKVQ